MTNEDFELVKKVDNWALDNRNIDIEQLVLNLHLSIEELVSRYEAIGEPYLVDLLAIRIKSARLNNVFQQALERELNE
jgi:hypothetical protein